MNRVSIKLVGYFFGLCLLALLTGCIQTPVTQTMAEAFGKGKSSNIDAINLNPNLKYLRVTLRERAVLMVLGYSENSPKGTKSHGHEISLVTRPRCPGPNHFYWRPGSQNLADYFTKHHPASHHKSFRSQILTSPSDPEYTKMLTPKATSTKSFVTNLLETPHFQVASNPRTFAAASA